MNRVGSSLDTHESSSFWLGAARAYELEEVKSVKVKRFCETINRCVTLKVIESEHVPPVEPPSLGCSLG